MKRSKEKTVLCFDLLLNFDTFSAFGYAESWKILKRMRKEDPSADIVNATMSRIMNQ
ncbi:MAG: hypothetical protein PVF15_09870 [Candidatus Bathyarchaeota archaeon]